MNRISWVFLLIVGREQGVIRLAPNSTLRSLTLPSPPFADAQGVASPLPTTPPGAAGSAGSACLVVCDDNHGSIHQQPYLRHGLHETGHHLGEVRLACLMD